MDSLILGFVYLVFGAVVIAILRRIALDLGVATVFKNSFFWLSLLSLVGLLLYITFITPTVQAKAVDPGDVLPLPPSDTPPKENRWKGLEAAWQAQYMGAGYAIYAEDLADSSRKIMVNADVEMPTASVYKLAVAYSILRSVANGTSWSSSLWNTTLENCFSRMVVESNNECAHAWGDLHGWRAITNEFDELGLGINLYGQTSATAREIAEFLKKVYRGQILNDELIGKLLSTMKIQSYRQGIPAGAPGKTVANKVGFMNGVLNDAGIVFSPDEDYVLVIFTNGYSWGSIAETTKLVDENY